MPPFLTTTLAAEIGHNSSAHPAYNKTNFPANFTGTTVTDVSGHTAPVNSAKFDDSLNPVTPAHISSRNIKLDLPGFTGKIFAHCNLWFQAGGAGPHIDVGQNANSNTYIDAMLQDMVRRGVDSLIIDWYGSTHIINQATLKVKARIAALGLPLTYHICIDAQSYSNDSDLNTHLAYINTTYFGDANYYKIATKPVVSFFDVVGGINYATDKAALGVSMYWIFENAGSLSNAYADGAFEWTSPYTTGPSGSDPYHLASQTFFLSTVHSSSKGTIPALNAKFNGTLTRSFTWSEGKVLPSDSGKNWQARLAAFLANIPTNCLGVQLITWQDYEEGTPLELGIENDLTVTASISSNLITFGVTGGTGDERTLTGYKILASPDGINAAVLATIAVGGGHTFDLSSISTWDDPLAPYQIYVVALSKAFFRDHSLLAGAYTPSTLDIITDNFAQFFLNSNTNVVQLDLVEIFHPSFSKTYRLVRNSVAGITVTLEDASVKTFDYYPLRLVPAGSKTDLDQTLEVTFGDLGQIIPQEIDRIIKSHVQPFYGGALLGAWTDAAGILIAPPFLIGNGGWFYVPGTAAKLSLGVQDNFYTDNTGFFTVNINGVNSTVNGTAKPWINTDPVYPFVATGATAPVVVTVVPGALLKIVVSGLVDLGAGFNPSDGLGDPLGGVPTSPPGTFVNHDPGPGSIIKPTLKYRTYRSDVLSEPLDGPFIFQVNNVSFQKQGATLQCSALRLNQNTTGEIYTMDRFPMLRGFL